MLKNNRKLPGKSKSGTYFHSLFPQVNGSLAPNYQKFVRILLPRRKDLQMNKKAPIALLTTLYATAFLAGFNENLVNMALMSIMSDFQIDSVTAQWLVTGYMIVSTVVVMCMAFFYQRFTLRQLYFSGAIFSIVGSAMGLFATTFEILMVARLIQALGTGIFIPLMTNTILVVTPKNKLGQFISIGGCMITFGPAFAPVVCGGIVSSFGWHAIFFLPTLIMIILTIIAIFAIKNLETNPAKLDLMSVTLATLFLITLSYGLSEFMSNILYGSLSLVICIAICIMFVLRQLKCKNPLINLSPMKSIRFWPSILLNTLAMMGTFSCSVLLPLYFEGACSLTPFVAGLVLLIPVLCNCGVTLIAGKIFDKFGEWPLLPIGFGIIAIGFLLLAFSATSLNLILAFLAAIAVYAGTGSVFSPSQTAGLKTLSAEENPHGVALSTTFIQIAACIGPSLYTGLLSFGQSASANAETNSSLALAEGFSLAMSVASILSIFAFIVAFIYSRASKVPIKKKDEASLTIAYIMKEVPWTVQSSASVMDAMSIMIDKKIGGLPIVDSEGNPKGFISDGDIMRYVANTTSPITSQYALLEMAKNQTMDEKVSELFSLEVTTIATENVVCLDINDSIEKALDILSTHKIKKLPILENGKIVGTLNRSDILRFIMQKFERQTTRE